MGHALAVVLSLCAPPSPRPASRRTRHADVRASSHVSVHVHTSPLHATISSGTSPLLDMRGRPVHAHGAGILAPEGHPAGRDGRYLMVGTSQKALVGGDRGWLSQGINLYSSFDLEHWAFEQMIFKNTSIVTPLPSSEPPLYRIERPKLVYNKLTRKYVLYFHLDSLHFKMGMVGVCVADSAAGTYSYVHGYMPDGMRSLDFTVFRDTDDAAYIVRSVSNKFTAFSKLSADYLNTTGLISRGPQCEAQTVWRDGDDLYLLGSHITGWEPNEAILAHAKGPMKHAVWETLGNPSNSSTTFNSQPNFVLPFRHRNGRKLLVYMGDRWNYNGAGSIGNASYVWLPMVESATSKAGFEILGVGGSGDGVWNVMDFTTAPLPLTDTHTPAPGTGVAHSRLR